MSAPVDLSAGRLSRNFSAAGSANPSADTERSKRLEKACESFEALFVDYMMQQMRQTVPRDGLFSGGRAEEIYTSMLDSELSQSIASHQRGLGLAAVLYRQLKDLDSQE